MTAHDLQVYALIGTAFFFILMLNGVSRFGYRALWESIALNGTVCALAIGMNTYWPGSALLFLIVLTTVKPLGHIIRAIKEKRSPPQ